MKSCTKITIPLLIISIILLITCISEPSSALQIPETLDQDIRSTGENIPANFTATQITQWVNNETIYVRSPDAKNDYFYKPLNLTTHDFNTTHVILNFTNLQPQNFTKEIEGWYEDVTPSKAPLDTPVPCHLEYRCHVI